jgi:hypothetical protein
MKFLLRVLFILALFCAFTSHARASAIDFHSTVLDPPPFCPIATDCFIFDNAPFTATFSGDQCGDLNLPNDGTTACFFGVNSTGEDITTLSLVFTGTTGLGIATCDNASVPPGPPSPIFGNPLCSSSGTTYSFTFTGGDILPDQGFIIFEDGAPASDLGTATVQLLATPEPDSLLLFCTGLVMAGLYLTKHTRLFASIKR